MEIVTADQREPQKFLGMHRNWLYILVVPGPGLEPGQCFHRGILSPSV